MFEGSSSRMTKGLFAAVIHFTAHAGAEGRLSWGDESALSSSQKRLHSGAKLCLSGNRKSLEMRQSGPSLHQALGLPSPTLLHLRVTVADVWAPSSFPSPPLFFNSHWCSFFSFYPLSTSFWLTTEGQNQREGIYRSFTSPSWASLLAHSPTFLPSPSVNLIFFPFLQSSTLLNLSFCFYYITVHIYPYLY